MIDESPVLSVRKKKKLKTELKETHTPKLYNYQTQPLLLFSFVNTNK